MRCQLNGLLVLEVSPPGAPLCSPVAAVTSRGVGTTPYAKEVMDGGPEDLGRASGRRPDRFVPGARGFLGAQFNSLQSALSIKCGLPSVALFCFVNVANACCTECANHVRRYSASATYCSPKNYIIMVIIIKVLARELKCTHTMQFSCFFNGSNCFL